MQWTTIQQISGLSRPQRNGFLVSSSLDRAIERQQWTTVQYSRSQAVLHATRINRRYIRLYTAFKYIYLPSIILHNNTINYNTQQKIYCFNNIKLHSSNISAGLDFPKMVAPADLAKILGLAIDSTHGIETRPEKFYCRPCPMQLHQQAKSMHLLNKSCNFDIL